MNYLDLGDKQELVWTKAPTGLNRTQLVVVLLVAVASVIAGFLLLKSMLASLVGPVIIVISISDVLLPTKYRLYAKGAALQRGLGGSDIAWENIRFVQVYGFQVHLSPVDPESKLGGTRGVKLLATEENITDVLAYIRSKVSENARILE